MTLVVVGSLAAAAGVVLFLSALRPRRAGSTGGLPAASHPLLASLSRTGPGRLVAGGTVGLLVGVLTGWPVAALLGAAAALGLPAMWGDRPAHRTIDQLEAVATWTEMVRDTLHASAGLAQALTATAPVAPAAIRPAVRLLADRLSAGVPMVQALRALADDLADPVGDVVVCALVLASSAQAQRLADLLGALAASARAEVAMRLRVEASRASARSSVRIVTVFTVGFMGTLLLVAHAYLAPFGSPGGQVVLALAGALDGVGLVLLARMARHRPAPRLLAPVTG